MLNNEAKGNIALIEATAKQVWGSNVEFGEREILDSPYSEFDWPMRLYANVDILVYYGRGTVDIGIPKDGEYVLMSAYTDKPFARGFQSTEPETLYNNFLLLDEVVRQYLLRG